MRQRGTLKTRPFWLYYSSLMAPPLSAGRWLSVMLMSIDRRVGRRAHGHTDGHRGGWLHASPPAVVLSVTYIIHGRAAGSSAPYRTDVQDRRTGQTYRTDVQDRRPRCPPRRPAAVPPSVDTAPSLRRSQRHASSSRRRTDFWMSCLCRLTSLSWCRPQSRTMTYPKGPYALRNAWVVD